LRIVCGYVFYPSTLVIISVCYASIAIAFLAPDLLAEQLNHRD
jgi:hypothetical protein